MRHRRKIISIIVFMLLAGVFYACYIWNKPARNVADESGIKITAVAIFDSFSNNEQSANTKFLNKAIEVTGMVTGVKKNQADQVVAYLKSSDPVFGVNCTFNQDPGIIIEGTIITFKGICTGYLSDVILDQGMIVK